MKAQVIAKRNGPHRLLLFVNFIGEKVRSVRSKPMPLTIAGLKPSARAMYAAPALLSARSQPVMYQGKATMSTQKQVGDAVPYCSVYRCAPRQFVAAFFFMGLRYHFFRRRRRQALYNSRF
jgi:hypothetical protein